MNPVFFSFDDVLAHLPSMNPGDAVELVVETPGETQHMTESIETKSGLKVFITSEPVFEEPRHYRYIISVQ